MGLDMSLSAKKYYSEFDPDSASRIQSILEASGLSDISDTSSVSVSISVMYWRKANQIHKWFVDNVQNGVDDCGQYFVSSDSLKELRDLCSNVLANPDEALNLLPPSSGFFFGSALIDDWYFDQLKYTVSRLDELFSLDLPEYLSFYYQSSW